MSFEILDLPILMQKLGLCNHQLKNIKKLWARTVDIGSNKLDLGFKRIDSYVGFQKKRFMKKVLSNLLKIRDLVFVTL